MERTGFFDGEQWRLMKQRSVEALLGDRRFLVRYACFWVLLVLLVVFLMAYLGFTGALVGAYGFTDAQPYVVFPWLGLVASFGAFGMGAMPGAQALVVERTVFVRECATANLNVAAYLGSKVHSLSLLGIVAVMLYLPVVLSVGARLGGVLLKVPIGWFLIVLLATMMCGVCFGLMVSAFSRSVKQSQVVVVGFMIVMMFLAGGSGKADSWVEMALRWLSPLGWPRASLLKYGAEVRDDMLATGHLLPLVWFSMVFLAIAYVILKRQGYGDSRE